MTDAGPTGLRVFIVQTVESFSNKIPLSGGVAHSIGLIREWSKLGVETILVSSSQDDIDASGMGVASVIRLKRFWTHRDQGPAGFAASLVLAHLGMWKELRRWLILADDKRTLLVTATPYPGDLLLAFRASRELRLPGAVHFHHVGKGIFWHPIRRGGIVRVAVGWAFSTFSLVVCKLGNMLPIINHRSDIELAGWKFDEVLEDGQFLVNPAPALENDSVRKIDACFVGRIAPNKGVEDLLRIWKRVVTSLPSASLVLAGVFYSEKYEMRVKRLTRELGLEASVKFLGFVSEATKVTILKSSKLFLFPSYEEGWSIGVMEAIHFGAVPIVYDLDAYDYLGSDVPRVPAGRIAEFATVASHLLKSDGQRAQVAHSLRVRIARYDGAESARSELWSLFDWGYPRNRGT